MKLVFALVVTLIDVATLLGTLAPWKRKSTWKQLETGGGVV